MKQKIDLTRPIKLLMIQALKNGFVEAKEAQELAHFFNVNDPFTQMRLNHGISIPISEWAKESSEIINNLNETL